MSKAASGSSCLSTCFGVGGDEEVWGVRTESPDGIPALGDVVHERNSSDWDEREASQGVTGLLNGLAEGQLWHDGGCEKFNLQKKKRSRSQNLTAKWAQLRPARPVLPRVLSSAAPFLAGCWPFVKHLQNLLLFDCQAHNHCVYILVTLSCLLLVFLSAGQESFGLASFLIPCGFQPKSSPTSESKSKNPSAGSPKSSPSWAHSWSLSASVTLKMFLSIFVTWLSECSYQVLVCLWSLELAQARPTLKCPYVTFPVTYEFHFCSQYYFNCFLCNLRKGQGREGLERAPHTTERQTIITDKDYKRHWLNISSDSSTNGRVNTVISPLVFLALSPNITIAAPKWACVSISDK